MKYSLRDRRQNGKVERERWERPQTFLLHTILLQISVRAAHTHRANKILQGMIVGTHRARVHVHGARTPYSHTRAYFKQYM